jgi:hypothetical protein
MDYRNCPGGAKVVLQRVTRHVARPRELHADKAPRRFTIVDREP